MPVVTIPLYDEVFPQRNFPPRRYLVNYPTALINDLIPKINSNFEAVIPVPPPDYPQVYYLLPSRAEGLVTEIPDENLFVMVFGYATAGDGGEALYIKVDSEPSHPGKFQSADGAWWELNVFALRPEMFGVIEDGVTDATPIIQLATECSVAQGFLPILLTAKTYNIGINTTSPYVTQCVSTNKFGVVIFGPTQIIGCGEASVLKRTDTGTAYITAIIAEGEGGGYKNLKIDGGAPSGGVGATYDNGMGISVECSHSSLENINPVIEDVWVVDTAAYGIGVGQWGNIFGGSLAHIDINGTGSDGIDIKMRNSPVQYNKGLVLNDITVRNFGKTSTDVGPQAGIGIKGWTLASNIYISNPGAKSNAGVHMQAGAPADISAGAQNASLTNFIINMTDAALAGTVYGVEINSAQCSVSNGAVIGCDIGLGFFDAGVAPDNSQSRVANIQATGCVIGFDMGTGYQETLVNLQAYFCDTGLYVRGDFPVIQGFTAIDCGTEVLVDATANFPQLSGLVLPFDSTNDGIIEDRSGFVTSGGMPRVFDDFFGVNYNTFLWESVRGTDPAAIAPFINAEAGGRVQLTTGASASANMATNGTQFQGEQNFRPANGHTTVFEARAKMTAIGNVAWFFGFTDQTSVLEMPFTQSGGTLTSNAADAVGILFDTAATSAVFRCVGVKNNVDGTSIATAISPTVSEYDTFRVEINASGVAKFYVNGIYQGQMTNAVTPGTTLVPVIAGFRRTSVAGALQVDYILAEGMRSPT